MYAKQNNGANVSCLLHCGEGSCYSNDCAGGWGCAVMMVVVIKVLHHDSEETFHVQYQYGRCQELSLPVR